jgi:hypothetical protein
MKRVNCDLLANAGAHFPTGGLEPDLSTFEQIGDCRDGFPIIFAAAADRKNEVTKAVAAVATDFLGMFFHNIEVRFGISGLIKQAACHF